MVSDMKLVENQPEVLVDMSDFPLDKKETDNVDLVITQWKEVDAGQLKPRMFKDTVRKVCAMGRENRKPKKPLLSATGPPQQVCATVFPRDFSLFSLQHTQYIILVS